LLSNAKLDLERTSVLATREYATRQTLDTQRALVLQLEAAIQGDQAAIDNAKVQLGYATITSPIAGRAGMRLGPSASPWPWRSPSRPWSPALL
jgi:multidrug efflux system membrane fusion protein